jgi:hypothetical protein
MKKNVLIAFIVFSTLDLFGQISKGKYIISLEGNYMKSNAENGVTTNLSSLNGQYLNIGFSYGGFFSDHFVFGVGFDYNWVKEARYNKLYVNNIIQLEKMDIKSNVFLPNIYLGFYFQIISKLYFNTNLKISYGIIKSDYETISAGSVNTISDSISIIDNNEPFLRSSTKESKSGYFSSQISPELTYFVSPKFGLFLGLGKIEYSVIDWKKESSNWVVNFNPSYWKFGLKVNI